MNVRLLLFASFREALGKADMELELPPGATAEELFSLLRERNSGLAALRPFTTFAVNREVVDGRTVLHDGDEVALLQPVSGGAL